MAENGNVTKVRQTSFVSKAKEWKIAQKLFVKPTPSSLLRSFYKQGQNYILSLPL
jgi:hypothetical protein